MRNAPRQLAMTMKDAAFISRAPEIFSWTIVKRENRATYNP